MTNGMNADLIMYRIMEERNSYILKMVALEFYLASRSKSDSPFAWTPEIPPTVRDRNAEALRPTSTSQ